MCGETTKFYENFRFVKVRSKVVRLRQRFPINCPRTAGGPQAIPTKLNNISFFPIGAWHKYRQPRVVHRLFVHLYYTASLKILSVEYNRLRVTFSTTYLCKHGFSGLLYGSNKQRNHLDATKDVCSAASSISPRISSIVNGNASPKITLNCFFFTEKSSIVNII